MVENCFVVCHENPLCLKTLLTMSTWERLCPKLASPPTLLPALLLQWMLSTSLDVKYLSCLHDSDLTVSRQSPLSKIGCLEAPHSLRPRSPKGVGNNL